ncbi:hypothetical protein [Cellulomonas soli]|uniref:Uncharacterized protein n=1 Tax=Cellulomonas soli TaxID=931535 RepID=A0A512PIP2_9CELL|nr:hypothetical protein [Cellulomonas soli]NYI58834.1 hypothetical protein [Cellulomonas soli]GEP71075.1 hypothetical protein CSO01_37900 [Cellulomonas soli]
MSTPRDDRPGTPPTTAGVGKQLARDMGQGLAEIAVWAVAVVVVVGGLGLLGSLVGGPVGFVVGALLGVLVLGVTWLVLLVAGVSLAAKVLRRQG